MALPSVFCVGGTQLSSAVPVWAGAAATVTVKEPRVADAPPAVTVSVMLANVPMSLALGVPLSGPVAA